MAKVLSRIFVQFLLTLKYRRVKTPICYKALVIFLSYLRFWTLIDQKWEESVQYEERSS